MKAIIFTADNQHALREGRKTVTRRVIKPQPIKKSNSYEWGVSKGKGIEIPLCLGIDEKQLSECMIKYPRYQVGEVVYIKEAWAAYENSFCTERYLPNWKHEGYHWHPVTHKLGRENYAWGLSGEPKWRNPRTMPASAARDFIKILKVDALRLLLPLSPEELNLEGGEQAITMLRLIDGEWVFRYEFQYLTRQEI